ncbi:TPA: hypothetical protein REU56_002919, partial [Listeria monocytogenes]|nr:hypothetical protein [Listeria monocytogenes]
EVGVHDKNYPGTLTDSLHNYFFVKSINKVRPGGIVMFITSSYTMDSKKNHYRKYLADRAEFLGAVRLPNNAFDENAATKVTTDIIILKKLPEGQKGSHDWVNTTEHEFKLPTPDFGRTHTNVTMNPYFVQHPEMVLGELGISKQMYGGYQPTVNPNGKDLKKQVVKALKTLPENAFEKVEKQVMSQEEIQRLTVPAPDFVKEGAYHFQDNRLYMKTDGQLVPIDMKGAPLERMKGLIGVRTALRELFQEEANRAQGKKSNVEPARHKLNKLYDAFVKKFKALNDSSNVKAFMEDPDFYLLTSIENYDKEKKTATKGDIFTKSTSSVYVPVTKVDNPREGMLVSLNEKGYIDPKRVAELTGLSEEGAIKELEPFIF